MKGPAVNGSMDLVPSLSFLQSKEKEMAIMSDPSKSHGAGDGVDVPDTVSTISDHVEEAYTKETTHDPVFGAVTEDGPNYRNVCVLGYIVLILTSNTKLLHSFSSDGLGHLF